VTVNSQLPVSGGKRVFDGAGASDSSSANVLWIPLLEKAYAQWSATGNAGRPSAQNSYASLAGGWMADVDAQVLGHAASSYDLINSSDQQAFDVDGSLSGLTGYGDGAQPSGELAPLAVDAVLQEV